jgi:hypothetical protein
MQHAKYSSPTVQTEVVKCYGMEMNVEKYYDNHSQYRL